MQNKEASFPENLPPLWFEKLRDEKNAPYFKELISFLNAEYKSKKEIYPARQHVLRALQSLDYDQVKVVILGQDPYHGPKQAIGLSFAVPNELTPKPPSLGNIFKEISSDLNVNMTGKGTDLSGWAAQGVLLLNTVLTVQASQAFSHRGKGWEQFTDKVIRTLNDREKPVVFLLWGGPAKKKKELITNKHHHILEAVHPSPLSAHQGFFGCKHFSKTNQILQKLNETPIDWSQTVG